MYVSGREGGRELHSFLQIYSMKRSDLLLAKSCPTMLYILLLPSFSKHPALVTHQLEVLDTFLAETVISLRSLFLRCVK